MIRNYLYWTSGAYKWRRDVKWHHSGKDTKAMKGRTGLDERLIDGQEDLGCLLKSPLSTPSAPTVTSAAPHTPGEREPGNKSHFRKEKEVCVCLMWDRNTDVYKTEVHLSLGLFYVGIKTFVLPFERCALQIFLLCKGQLPLQGR